MSKEFTREHAEYVIKTLTSEILMLGKHTGLPPEHLVDKWVQLGLEAMQLGAILTATAYMSAAKALDSYLEEHVREAPTQPPPASAPADPNMN